MCIDWIKIWHYELKKKKASVGKWNATAFREGAGNKGRAWILLCLNALGLVGSGSLI